MLFGAVAVAVVAPATAASAEPTPAELTQQIDQSSIALEKIVENYNGLTEQLKATQATADDLNTKMAPLQANLDKAYASIGQIAVRAYKGGGVTPMAVLLADGNTNGLLTQLSSLNHLAQAQEREIQGYSRQKAQYDEQRAKLDALLAKQQADQKTLADQKVRIEADLAKLMEMRRKANLPTVRPNPPSNGGGSGAAPAPSQPKPAPPSVGGGAGAAVRFAYGVLGAPYVWAGEGPGYDCSGLIKMAWRAGGKALPHNAAMQWNATTHISAGQLAPGDLVFYYGLGHVALYVGGGQVIHAPHAGDVVRLGNVNMSRPYGYGRVR
jgi:peptidoglycan DL-endopeptidase CwlO